MNDQNNDNFNTPSFKPDTIMGRFLMEDKSLSNNNETTRGKNKNFDSYPIRMRAARRPEGEPGFSISRKFSPGQNFDSKGSAGSGGSGVIDRRFHTSKELGEGLSWELDVCGGSGSSESIGGSGNTGIRGYVARDDEGERTCVVEKWGGTVTKEKTRFLSTGLEGTIKE